MVARTCGQTACRASAKPWWTYPLPPGPGHGGVVASESQSRSSAGSVPRKLVMIMLWPPRVYAWVSSSGNGGRNLVW